MDKLFKKKVKLLYKYYKDKGIMPPSKGDVVVNSINLSSFYSRLIYLHNKGTLSKDKEEYLSKRIGNLWYNRKYMVFYHDEYLNKGTPLCRYIKDCNKILKLRRRGIISLEDYYSYLVYTSDFRCVEGENAIFSILFPNVDSSVVKFIRDVVYNSKSKNLLLLGDLKKVKKENLRYLKDMYDEAMSCMHYRYSKHDNLDDYNMLKDYYEKGYATKKYNLCVMKLSVKRSLSYFRNKKLSIYVQNVMFKPIDEVPSFVGEYNIKVWSSILL